MAFGGTSVAGADGRAIGVLVMATGPRPATFMGLTRPSSFFPFSSTE